MFTRKINIIWILNLLLFVSVVVLGIEQAGRGVDISNLERKTENSIVLKRDLSEKIFTNESDNRIISDIETLGYVKPTEILYFKTDDIFASLPTR